MDGMKNEVHQQRDCAAGATWIARGVLYLILGVEHLARILKSALLTLLALLTTRNETNPSPVGKKPVSLKCTTLVVAQPELTEADMRAVAKALSWALKMGVQYIFGYDPEGPSLIT